MKRKILLLVLIAGLCIEGAFAQSIFDNPITFATATPPSPYTAGQTVDPNMTASGISRGPGITGQSAANRYIANGWSTGGLNTSDYFEFTMTPNTNYAINLSSFVYTGQVSAGTPSVAFRSSLDGFTSNIGTPTYAGSTISLSAPAYQNLTTAITFRFYVYGMSASTTTYSINDFTFNGTVTPVVVAPEINIRGNNITIAPGNTPFGLDNTLWAGQTIGTTSGAKTFEIQNLGTAALNLTGSYVALGGAHAGDWTIATMPSTSIAASGNSTFNVTFTPTGAGTRNATLSVFSNDSDEPTYTWNIQGTGDCAAATNVITPTSGPVGTEVTVTASANNLTGATATIGGIAATVTQVSATQIKVLVPAGAVSGTLVTTNSEGCTASNPFTVITNVANGCQGSSSVSELFITEVTDASSGGLTYVEIFNGTGAAVNLSQYSIRTANNGGAYNAAMVNLNNVNLANNATYVVSLASDSFCSVPGGNGSLANQASAIAGINFDPGQNDHIALFKSGVIVDAWGDFGVNNWADGLGLGDRGATFRRKNNVTVPNTTYNNSDWDITDWAGTGAASCSTNDYSDIGTFNFLFGIPPTVTQQPSFSPSCKSTALTVAGTEGSVGGNALAYQWFAVAPNTATWTALSDGGVYTGTTSATLNISNITGLDGYQFYCQIRENTATCYTASNAVKIEEAITVTWNGTWSPSAPTGNSVVVIDGAYDTAVNGNIDACSLIVNSPNTLIVAPNGYVNIQNDLTVNAGATLQVQDDGSLVMIDNAGVVTNNGTTQIVRTTSPYNKFDYTYWSSPVAAATIGSTFTGWRTDYAFHFVTGNFADISPADGFDDDQNAWVYQAPATVMTKGKGYAIMAPTTGTFPTTSTVTFSGAVNNGIVNILLGASANGASAIDDFNLIGNPYPSAIYANDFINANSNISGTLYFWTHRTGISNSNPGPDANNFITADYAMYNLSGGTSSGTGSPAPSGYIASGEGFFVEANAYTNVVFDNAMRSKVYDNSQFYRPANNDRQLTTASESATERDRLWVNLESGDGLFSQQLIAYFENTTLDFDRGYDGLVSKSNATLSFYSFIGDDKYRIQARPAFDVNDVVPLGYSSTMAGTYKIMIGAKEGQLNYDDTNIYLEDKLLGLIHDLKQAPYSFTTAVGEFNDRFVLRYQNSALGNENVEALQNNVAVAVSDSQIHVKSFAEPIASIAVYDILGRRLFADENVSANDFAISGVTPNRQALIVKVKLETGSVVNRKIVF